jgi:hypothetical protein
MRRRMTKRILKKLAEVLFMTLVAVAMVFCLVKFINAEDVYDKVEYGVWIIIGLILTFRE